MKKPQQISIDDLVLTNPDTGKQFFVTNDMMKSVNFNVAVLRGDAATIESIHKKGPCAKMAFFKYYLALKGNNETYSIMFGALDDKNAAAPKVDSPIAEVDNEEAKKVDN